MVLKTLSFLAVVAIYLINATENDGELVLAILFCPEISDVQKQLKHQEKIITEAADQWAQEEKDVNNIIISLKARKKLLKQMFDKVIQVELFRQEESLKVLSYMTRQRCHTH